MCKKMLRGRVWLASLYKWVGVVCYGAVVGCEIFVGVVKNHLLGISW